MEREKKDKGTKETKNNIRKIISHICICFAILLVIDGLIYLVLINIKAKHEKGSKVNKEKLLTEYVNELDENLNNEKTYKEIETYVKEKYNMDLTVMQITKAEYERELVGGEHWNILFNKIDGISVLGKINFIFDLNRMNLSIENLEVAKKLVNISPELQEAKIRCEIYSLKKVGDSYLFDIGMRGNTDYVAYISGTIPLDGNMEKIKLTKVDTTVESYFVDYIDDNTFIS